MANSLSQAQFLKNSALKMLAMREHSQFELREKLMQKAGVDEGLEALLAYLAEADLQSDVRFAEAFLQMRRRQGKGPLLIRMELKQKGISPELIADLVDEQDINWVVLAANQRLKKFGPELPLGGRERARQVRFLQARGFSVVHIRQALATKGNKFY